MAQTIQRRTQRPRRLRKWLRPAAIEREYVRYLRSIAAEVNAAIEANVIPVLADLRLDDWRDIPPSTGWYETLRQAVVDAAAAIALPALTERVAQFGRRVSDFNASQFHALLRAAYRVDIFLTEPWLAEVLSQFEAE